MSLRRLAGLFVFLGLGLLISGYCNEIGAAPAKTRARPVTVSTGRTVLALFKSSENDTAESNLVRRFAAPLLQEAGYRVEYHDIEASLPADADMGRYAAVVTWFKGARMKGAQAYPAWLARQLRAGRKVVVLGNFGAFTPDDKYFTPENYLNEFFVPFGVKYRGQWTGKADLLKVVTKDAAMVESPSPIDLSAINHYVCISSHHAENKAYLVVNRTDIKDGESAIVVRTPHGGLALEGYLYTGDPDQKAAWHLNLSAFLKESLGYQATQTSIPKKRVLALYKSSEGASEQDNEIRKFAWEPLYKLGYEVEFRDADAGWPALAEMDRFDAIITWYRGATMPNAAAYAEWLADNMAQGRRVIVMGNYGAFQEKIEGKGESYFRWLNLEEYNNFFAPFGLEFQRQWTNDGKVLKVAHKDPQMIELQIPLAAEDVRHYFRWKNLHAGNEPYLTLDRSDLPDGKSPVVVRTVGGGMALEGYLYVSKPPNYVLQWRLNLPEFLKRSLEFRPDTMPTPAMRKVPDAELMQIDPNARKLVWPTYPPSALPSGGSEFKRVVLGLYKGTLEQQSPEKNLIAMQAEAILNHLGVRVEYRDIEKGLPGDEEMAAYMGVVTWFKNSVMDDPEAYAAWVKRQVDQGRKMVILGDPGLRFKKTKMVTTPGERALYAALGMKYTDPEAATQVLFADEKTQKGGGQRRLSDKGCTVVRKDPKMVEFETPLNLGRVKEFSRVHNVDPRNKVYLTVHVPRWGRTDPVVTGPFGGLADRDFAYMEPLPSSLAAIKPGQEEESEEIGRWRIDPFLFFNVALGLEETPRLDVTTLNGSRVFYSHIDGDGFPGISLIDKSSLAPQFILDEVFKKYPLPVSISIIAKDMEMRTRRYYNREVMLAREILALDNIEPATHTYSHPFNWRSGDLNVVQTDPELRMEKRQTDITKQITYSINFINRYLCPPGKRVEILFWSGNCFPDEDAIAAVDANGCRNLNGGDPIFDSHFPSVSTLCGLSGQVGSRRQYYTSARGEFLYTDGWTKNFDGMKKLVDHYEHTESPRRLMPINVYYHFYVGDRVLGLDGLKKPYDYAMERKVAPLFASQYVDSVSDWLTARIFREGEAWIVVNSGTCRTVRFDLKGRHVDLGRSRGVLGYNHHNDSLYVHLDDSNRHEIYLSDKPAQGVYLVQGTQYTNDWKPTAGGVSFQLRGLGPAHYVVAGFSPGQSVPVEVTRADDPESGSVVLQKTVAADAAGRITFDTVLKGYNRAYAVRVGNAGASRVAPRVAGRK